MNPRLVELLDAAWQHDAPGDPEWTLDDLEEADRQRMAWVDSLSADDSLLLIDWIKNPRWSPGWGPTGKWIVRLPEAVALYVGEAGKRLRDPRIVPQLLDALQSLPLGETRTFVGVAIGYAATADEIERLRRIEPSGVFPLARTEIDGVVAAWKDFQSEERWSVRRWRDTSDKGA